MNDNKSTETPETIDGGAVSVDAHVSTFNMNNLATVKLTDEGEKIYRKHFTDYPTLMKMKDDKTVTTHLWEFFHIFGEHIYMGCQTPFENNLITINQC